MKILYHQQGFIAIIFVCCCLINSKTAGTTGEIPPVKIQEEYNILLNVLSDNIEWSALPDPTMKSRAEVLTRLWSVVSLWTVAWLENTPDMNAAELVQALETLDSLEAIVVQLVRGEQATFAISANIWERSGKYSPALSGTIFIVKRMGAATFQVVWTIKEIADQRADPLDEFGAWSDFCRCNGPLLGYVEALPPNQAGQPRFYVRAIRATGMGEMPRQLSIWEWNGREARSLLIHTYRATAETEPARFDGEYITLTTKEDYVMVWSCDMNCPGAEVIWRIHVTPSDIEDEGRTYLEPDVKLLSNLWERILRHENTSDFASSHVVETILRVIQEAGGSLGQGGNQMTIAIHPDNSRILCIHADELSNYLFFEIEDKHGTPYFSNIAIVDDCEHCCGRLNDEEINEIMQRLGEHQNNE